MVASGQRHQDNSSVRMAASGRRRQGGGVRAAASGGEVRMSSLGRWH